MTYDETISYLYAAAPLFQQVGSAAYKDGLENTLLLDEHFHHPHRDYRTIHVGGTNGKGSCAHTLAAALQCAGLRVGLYTSPHLADFRERIRVNGEMMPKQRVIDFVAQERAFFEPLHPSFFELTTALAFKYFAEEHVDVAVIEVGLGGRLDCTNIIRPALSLITNISLDHTQFLGDTPAAIAYEKAGIIKANVPAVIGEATAETRAVFSKQAEDVGTLLYFAQDQPEVLSHQLVTEGNRPYIQYKTRSWGTILGELTGNCQVHNANTTFCALRLLAKDFSINQEAVARAFRHVTSLTGLRGRWERLCDAPQVVCDTGHNPGGWQYLGKQLAETHCEHLRIVFGMAGDKDVHTVLNLLPHHATYYFTQASVRRAMPADQLQRLAQEVGLQGKAYTSVAEAYAAARQASTEKDFIYIGGSSFVVADLICALEAGMGQEQVNR